MVLSESYPVDQQYIILSASAEVIHEHKAEADKLFASLSVGNAEYVRSFCAKHYDDCEVRFDILPVLNEDGEGYIFLEKNIVGGEVINILILTDDISKLEQYISPSTELYQTVTGKCIYGLLHTLNDPCGKSCVTPEAFLISENIPELRDELLYKGAAHRLCDIRRVVDEIIRELDDAEYYPPTEFSVKTNDHVGDYEKTCEKIPVASFVHLFMALTGIYSVIAVGHKINITVSLRTSFTEVEFSADVSDTHTIGANASLSALASLAEDYGIIARVASAAALVAGISAAVSCNGRTLKTVLNLKSYSSSLPAFKYNDPYSPISSLVARISEYFSHISA